MVVHEGASGELPFSLLEQFKPPREIITQLNNLVTAWEGSRKSRWSHLILPPSAVPLDAIGGYMHREMAHLVTGHELTHWFETIYKDEEWARMMTAVRGHLFSWLAEEKHFPDSRVVDNARRMLKDPAILDSWVREIHADCGAFDFFYASATHGGWGPSREALRDAYVYMSFFFSLLTLFELYEIAIGQGEDATTHPTAVIRRSVWCHIQAKKYGMSQEDFLCQQFGAGFFVQCIMEAIFKEYASVLKRRFGA